MMNWFENLLLLWVLAPENHVVIWRQWKFFCWVEFGESRLKLSWVSNRKGGITRERNKQRDSSVRIRCQKLNIRQAILTSSVDPGEEQERSKNCSSYPKTWRDLLFEGAYCCPLIKTCEAGGFGFAVLNVCTVGRWISPKLAQTSCFCTGRGEKQGNKN